MPNISRTKTWNANETLTAADLNAEFDGLLNGINDNALDNDNLSQTDDYLLGSLVLGSGISAGGGDGKLHVHVASAGTITAHADANDVTIENSTNTGLTIFSGTTGTGNIHFGDSGDNDIGKISYDHNANDLIFTANAAEIFRYDQSDDQVEFSKPPTPVSDDGVALGASGTGWSDLFLASGGVINWNAGDVTLTHASNKLSTAGGDIHIGDGTGLVVGHTAQIDFEAANVTPEVQILGTARVDAGLAIGRFSADTAGPAIWLAKSRNASIGSYTVVQDNDTMGQILFGADDGTDTETTAAFIQATVDDASPASNAIGGDLQFWTYTTAGVATEALRIDSSQNVGIGGAPEQLLHLTASAVAIAPHASSNLVIEDNGGTNYLQFLNNDGQTAGILFGDASDVDVGNIYYDHSSNLMNFTVAAASVLQLTSGKAAVGTAVTPDGTLHVHTATAGTVAPATNADDLVVENSGGGGIGILTPDANSGVIHFVTPTTTGSKGAHLDWNHNSNTFTVGGVNASSTLALQAGGSTQMTLTSGGLIGINETANGNMTIGLTINQGAASNQTVALKSDVTSGLTTAIGINVETDDYLTVQKYSGTLGGTRFISVAKDDAGTNTSLGFIASGATGNTSKANNGAIGLVDFLVMEHDGANALADVTANGNVFSVRARVGGSNLARMVLDEDGELHLTNTTLVALSDNLNDVNMIRAFETARHEHGAAGYVQSKWDEFVTEREDDLIEAGILGDTIENGGMWNINRHTMMLNGAVWQNHVAIQETREQLIARLDERDSKIAALEHRLNLIENKGRN